MSLAPVTRTISVASSQHVPGNYPGSDASSPTVTTQLSLAQAVHARRDEYIRPRKIRIRVGTWNVAAFNGTENDIGQWFVHGKGISDSLSGNKYSNEKTGDSNGAETEKSKEGANEQERRWAHNHSTITTIPVGDEGDLPGKGEVGIYVLGLQEVVDINSASEALRPYTDPTPAHKFKRALAEELPQGYQLIAERQLIGLLLLVYAAPDIAPTIENVSTTSVGTGVMGYLGNKGAVTARIILGETTRLVFVNSHLSAGSSKAENERRNWDAAQILQRTRFDPIVDTNLGITRPAEKIGDEDFAFWFGDLNYRLEGIPPEDVRRILMLHTQDEYDVGQKSHSKIEHMISHESNSTHRNRTSTVSSTGSGSTSSPTSNHSEKNETLNPSSLQATIDSLISHDELHQQQEQRKMFHDGWREGPITFLPTYKYDRGTVGVFDSGEKRRGPSWCDRILYRTRKDLGQYEERLKYEAEARKRDAAIKAQGLDKAVEDESTLFEYDPEADADNEYDGDGSLAAADQPAVHVTTKDGFEDTIRLEHYLSHQRVLSSDHKPLVADFILTYDAAVPDLKAALHREVARELDKAENEGRPMITMVIDGTAPGGSPESDGVDFGRLRFEDVKLRSLTIANTGRVPAHFGFANTPVDPSAPSVRWVSASVDMPSNKNKPAKEDEEWFAGLEKVFTILPGDSTTVELTAQVSDKELATRLNDEEVLEDVLVLRVKDGRDHFLPVRGTWHKSTHAVLLENLRKVPEHGLRMLQNQHPIGSWSLRGGSKESRVSEGELVNPTELVPSQITRLTGCVEALVERILAEWSMLGITDHAKSQPWATVAGWPFVTESWELDIRSRKIMMSAFNEALDTGPPLDSAFKPDVPLSQRIEVAADCLLSLLHNLGDGVITQDLWTQLEQDFFSQSKHMAVLDVEEQRVMVLRILSKAPSHCATFLRLTSSLHRIAQETSNALQEAITMSGVIDTSTQQTLLSSPKVPFKAKSFNSDRVAANKYLIQANLAAALAEVMVRMPLSSSKTAIDDSRKLVFMFLDES